MNRWPQVALQAFPVTDLVNEIGVDFVLILPTNNSSAAVGVYDFHFDLTLSNNPGFRFDDDLLGAIVFSGDNFGVGPDISADVVPETGRAGIYAFAITSYQRRAYFAVRPSKKTGNIRIDLSPTTLQIAYDLEGTSPDLERTPPTEGSDHESV